MMGGEEGPSGVASGSENPLTLSREELIAALTGSGGYIAFVYIGWGWAQFVAWRPETDQFEVVTSYRRPTLKDGLVVIEDRTRDHYAMDEAGLRDWLPENPSAPPEADLHPINYEDTPFPDAGVPEETWKPGTDRVGVVG
ncbi:hypothetical protein [Natronosalvus rutilus]|uniref:Uncharacterized protein n=1 Tax=Natronosalvus rutilus TaxID=2953753 RepID=A0A9E7SZL3_9EURY|nr:hypothetical protein [Natronosalvus rutilus]UTF56008.1 hypothetical protein NGM29_20690 [Natronosalvus rutilus]